MAATDSYDSAETIVRVDFSRMEPEATAQGQ
jgi:hypothetical protein